MPRSQTLSLLILAVLFTLLNAFRPLHMDDTAYYYYAAQIAEHPLDPYGFEIFWTERPQPAHEVLAPPLLPYYWAAAIRLFGDRPFLWKLWLLPFALLFVLALHRLFRRFAPGCEGPLVWLTVFSPAFLPSFSLMLDVPALALGLWALTQFSQSCDRDAPGPALLAGLVAGLAAQTKYTGLLVPAAMLVYALVVHRARLGILATLIASLVFAAWEAFIARRYGESHFLSHLHSHGEAVRQNPSAVLSLIMILGGTAPATMLLGLVALRARLGMLALAGAGVVLGFALLPYLDERTATDLGIPLRLNRDSLIFGGLGYLVCGTVAVTIRQLYQRTEGETRTDGKSAFLLLWLGLEIVGYLVLSPFPAVRRVLGIVVVSLLLIGRLLSRAGLSGTWRVRGVVAAGMVLGLGYYGVDLRDAWAQKQAAEQAARWVRQQQRGTGWYVGRWGFQYYAEHAGLRPVLPGMSALRRDDWLIVPCSRVAQQAIQIPDGVVLPAAQFRLADAVPFRTTSGYYGSRTPVEPLTGPRLSVTIYRVLADFIPSKTPSPNTAPALSRPPEVRKIRP